MLKRSFPFIKQLDSMDCGPSCIRMVARYYGKNISLQKLTEKGHMQKEGISLFDLSKLAERIGIRTLYVKVDYEKLIAKVPLPVIAHWNQNHYVVVYKITGHKVYVSDPAFGLVTYTREEFMKGWAHDVTDGSPSGVLLVMEPLPEFFELEEHKAVNKASFKFLSKYLFRYKYHLIQLMTGLLLGSVIQLAFPFLTRAIVDYGIGNRNVHFIYLILVAQLILYFSGTIVEFIRSWTLIHVSSRINVFIISDFLIKLMKLPMRFFDSKVIGDLIQRIQDHKRVEQFITDNLLKSLFSVFSVFILCSILAVFNGYVFLIFSVGTVIELSLIFFFFKKIKVFDNKTFALMAEDQGKLIEMIHGMQEIKLNNLEKKKRWEWERIQAKLFDVNLNKLKMNQYQLGGQRFFNYLQSVLIIFVSAMAVVDGSMTIGTMMAIIFILGQLNTPISQLINFILSGQLAFISLERLGEIHNKEDEDTNPEGKAYSLPADKSIYLDHVSFGYSSKHSENVLKDICLTIPEGKTTAIVGVSGSGKTTLLKLLLKFYAPHAGNISIGGLELDKIDNAFWRDQCGTVMQESFIFSDTIANNIALHDDVDKDRLVNATSVANIHSFIESLPLGYNTKIGQDGIGLSQGQKQRLMIARAVYKNPRYLFFDEATNALDAKNELIIMRNMEEFFVGRTVVVVAHRLSTVKNADQIIVIDEGQIVEYGNHELLIENKNRYFELVKNQLELGK